MNTVLGRKRGWSAVMTSAMLAAAGLAGCADVESEPDFGEDAAVHERELVRVASRLSPLLLQRPQAVQRHRLDGVAARLRPAIERKLVKPL